MGDNLTADGLHVDINAIEALDWLHKFLTTHKFSYPIAEAEREFAVLLIQGLKNERVNALEFGDLVEDIDGFTGRVIGVKEDGSVRYQNPSWGIDESHRKNLKVIRKWFDAS